MSCADPAGSLAPSLAGFLAANPRSVVCEIIAARGSCPREAGTFMVVGADAVFGSIGGGALEYRTIEQARQMLASGTGPATLTVPLGPDIGQCCGGRVTLELRPADAALAATLIERVRAEAAAAPHIYVFGAGHVGRALAQILALLPFPTQIVDTRAEALAALPAAISRRHAPLPEMVVRAAPPGSAFVILTHDHALDFLIAFEALKREDSAYVGMVGSRSKRAKFAHWFVAEGGDRQALERLVLPIGAQGLGDKRPAIIATLTAAEILVRLGTGRNEQTWRDAQARLHSSSMTMEAVHGA